MESVDIVSTVHVIFNEADSCKNRTLWMMTTMQAITRLPLNVKEKPSISPHRIFRIKYCCLQHVVTFETPSVSSSEDVELFWMTTTKMMISADHGGELDLHTFNQQRWFLILKVKN